MTTETRTRGLLDTGVLILQERIDPASLPVDAAISAVNLAELSAGPHQVRLGSSSYDGRAELARRMEVLQRAESRFDPIPLGAAAARTYGRVVAAVLAAGRSPRGRIADLLIASVAITEGLPLYTTNPDDFVGLEDLLDLVTVTPRPHQAAGR